MARRGGAVHVTTHRRHYTGKDGVARIYETHLLRRSFREDGKVRNETVANLSHLPAGLIDQVRRSLNGEEFVPAAGHACVVRSLPHGHVAAVAAQAKALGLPGLLGPAGRARDLAFALVVARVCRPGSKLATTRWWADTTLAADLGVANATTDEVYAAMDWLAARQDGIEAKLARRHLGADVNPDRLAMFDLSSSWVTGRHCPLAAHGYSRDGKKGLPQIEYGLLTDPAGRPVAVKVFGGNTADPAAFTAITEHIRGRFNLGELVMVGDRGMITSARIEALRQLGGYGWVTALRAPQIAALAADGGPLQPTLFDQTDLAEITHPDYPGERLVACRNPALADERARKRTELLAATDTDLAKIAAAVAAGRLRGADKIGIRVGKVIDRRKMAKHYTLEISDDGFSFDRDENSIAAEAALDGIYIIRTTIGESQMGPGQVVATYKNLSRVERDFRSLKTIDLDLRPIHHRTETRVRAHVFICMLAAYLTWHLRAAWAPLTFTDEHRPQPANPVAPAKRSTSADRKAATKTTADGLPAHSFTSLLAHLATLTRNDLRYGDNGPVVPTLAAPTPTQRRAFDLINTPIPIAIGK
ncbi:MAG: IS1634 family transposase [Candidatus Nanopelagicales bacterium]|nr:IS1634 family transposase [Candidatus Nanopelagicales bacterium]